MERPIKKYKFICKNCKKEFMAWISQKRVYCSDKCRLYVLHKTTAEKRKTGSIKRCNICNAKFYVPKWKENIGKGKFCSRICYAIYKSKSIKGNKNPMWEDGRTKKYKKAFYLSCDWRKLRKKVYKRDNYTCKYCNKQGGKIAAHHIIPNGICKNPLDISNIITLCQKCHVNIHNKMRCIK